jgi:hypothetical protein
VGQIQTKAGTGKMHEGGQRERTEKRQKKRQPEIFSLFSLYR